MEKSIPRASVSDDKGQILDKNISTVDAANPLLHIYIPSLTTCLESVVALSRLSRSAIHAHKAGLAAIDRVSSHKVCHFSRSHLPWLKAKSTLL